MNIIIKESPDWIYEVAVCISERMADRVEKTIEKADRYGLNKEDAHEFFKKYQEYKTALESEIIPIYEKDELMKSFFKTTEYEGILLNDVSVSFIFSMEGYLYQNGVELAEDIMGPIYANKTIKIQVAEFMMSLVESLEMDQDILSIETTANDDYSVNELIKSLYQINVPDDFRMKLIWIYSNYEQILNHLVELFRVCVPICIKHYQIIQDDFTRSTGILKGEKDILRTIEMETSVKLDVMDEYIIVTAIMPYNRMMMTFINDKYLIYIGMYMLCLRKIGRDSVHEAEEMTDDAFAATLKALAEPNRMKIMRLLTSEQMYMQELAEKLGLTTATVSHHITTLVEVDLITVVVETKDKKKIYYQVCEETLKKVAGMILRIPQGNLLVNEEKGT